MYPYLKVGELGVVEVRVNVQRGAHHQQRFKLVQGRADVASEAQTPDFQKSLQVKQHCKGNLGWNRENRNIQCFFSIPNFCLLSLEHFILQHLFDSCSYLLLTDYEKEDYETMPHYKINYPIL